MQIASATVIGNYRNLVGDLTRLEMKGPDLILNASGPLALNRSSSSRVQYHLDAKNLAEIGRLGGLKDLGGTAIVDGTLTGNAASLQTSGTIAGNNISYRGNEALEVNGTFEVTVPELTVADAKVSGDLAANFVKVAGLEINEVKGKASYAAQRLEFSTNVKHEARELDAAGSVIFHPDHQELHLPQLAIRAEGQEWRMASGDRGGDSIWRRQADGPQSEARERRPDAGRGRRAVAEGRRSVGDQLEGQCDEHRSPAGRTAAAAGSGIQRPLERASDRRRHDRSADGQRPSRCQKRRIPQLHLRVADCGGRLHGQPTLSSMRSSSSRRRNRSPRSGRCRSRSSSAAKEATLLRRPRIRSTFE